MVVSEDRRGNAVNARIIDQAAGVLVLIDERHERRPLLTVVRVPRMTAALHIPHLVKRFLNLEELVLEQTRKCYVAKGVKEAELSN